MDPVKRPNRYREMADPQARPRYTGIPTFFRAPHTESLADVDIGVIGVPYQRWGHESDGRASWATCGPRSVLSAATVAPARDRAVRCGEGARSRGLLDRAAV